MIQITDRQSNGITVRLKISITGHMWVEFFDYLWFPLTKGQ